MQSYVGCFNVCLVGCWELYILAKSKLKPEWTLTYDSVHSWRLYGADLMGNQAASNITQYHIQSHYSDTELTRPSLYPINAEPQTMKRKESI